MESQFKSYIFSKNLKYFVPFIPPLKGRVFGTEDKLTLDDRIYKCSCGYEQDRDVHSANNILIIGQKYKSNSGMEHISTTLKDETSGKLSSLNNLSHNSMKEEATIPLG